MKFMTKTKKFRALEKSRALSFFIFILEVWFMSKIDFILPKVDGKLDVKTPSRWHISDHMLVIREICMVYNERSDRYDRKNNAYEN